jgi:hypothetical protein
MQEDFKEYLKEARQRFCNETQKYSVADNLRLRTEVDSFLIAYDQAVAKAFSLQGVGHRRELLLFRKWQKENWKNVYLYGNKFMVDTYLNKK